ncbi:MAG: transporter substrate-binding protein [Oscillospiraceae bacterium]|nr:transporter substrate-binding protein [Oscillospiraceae bacterium]
MRRKLTLFLSLVLILSMAACGDPQESVAVTSSDTASAESTASGTQTEAAQAAVFALPYYPSDSLHPITSDNRVNLTIAPLVYEGLFELDDQFQVENVLCLNASASADYLQWTFTLRSGVTFSDGSPLTADDVVTSFNEARSSSQYAARFSGVSSVTASGDSVVVVLKQANSNFPVLLDFPIIREQSGDIPLGTGPFRFSGTSDSLSLVRNSHSWRTVTFFQDTIPLYAISSASDLISVFETGEISLVSSDLTGTNSLGFSSGYDTWEYNTTTMLYLGFNCSEGVCKTAAVRKALSMGLNRGEITASLLAGHAVEAELPFSPVSTLYSQTLAETLSYSPQNMLTALSDAGYTAGTDGTLYNGRKALSLTLVINTDNSFKVAVAEYLAEQLEGLGITVDLQKLSYEDYLSALKSKDFDVFLGEVKLTADFNLSPLITSGGALNYGGYYSQNAVSLLNTFLISDDDSRADAAYALSETLAEEAPFAVLCFKTNSVLTRWGMLTGLSPTRQNVFYGLENWQLKQ